MLGCGGRLRADLAAAPEPPPLVALHPTALAQYERQTERLQEAVTAGIAAGDGEAAAALRDLVERVTVFRNPDVAGGVKIEIEGRLSALLGEAAFPNRVSGVWGAMVAEERYIPTPRRKARCSRSGPWWRSSAAGRSGV